MKTVESKTKLYVWGNNSKDQLCVSNTSSIITNSDQIRCILEPQIILFDLQISAIACGESFALFLTNDGQVFSTTSFDSIDSFGFPYPVNFSNKYTKIKQISCGWSHSVAITGFFTEIFLIKIDQGEAYSWGIGKTGALGHENSTFKSSPEKIEYFENHQIIIRQASCGSHHTMFVDQNGKTYACGSNHMGQLGLGNKESKYIPTLLNFNQGKIIQIACGVMHSLILLENGEIYSMGANNLGQLGLGNKINSDIPKKISTLEGIKITKISAYNHSAAISSEGDFYLWGTGAFGEYMLPHKITFIPNPVKDICLGSCFGLALDKKGIIWSYGNNTSGELGLGDFENRAFPYPISSLQSENIRQIACGTNFCMILIGDHIQKNVQGLIRRTARETPNIYQNKLENTAPLLKNTDNSKFLELEISAPPTIVTRSLEKPVPAGKLVEIIKKERDHFEESLNIERAEKHKIEQEIYDLKKQIKDLTIENEKMKIDLENYENVKKDLLEYHKIKDENEQLKKQNMELSNELLETKDKNEKNALELALIQKDLDLLKHKSESESSALSEKLDFFKSEKNKVFLKAFIFIDFSRIRNL